VERFQELLSMLNEMADVEDDSQEDNEESRLVDTRVLRRAYRKIKQQGENAILTDREKEAAAVALGHTGMMYLESGISGVLPSSPGHTSERDRSRARRAFSQAATLGIHPQHVDF
jgi:hypothetical protein